MSEKPHVRVVSAEIQQDGRYLITQRRPNAVLPLLWEFPGGKVEPGESDEQALARELNERLGVAVEVLRPSMNVEHAYDSYVLELHVYHCRIAEGQVPAARAVHALKWVRPEEFAEHPFPGADQATVDLLLGR